MVFLNVVLPVFLIIALGFGIRRVNFVDKLFLEKISHLAYFVAVPALLTWKVGTASFDLNFNPRMILGCYLTVGGCGLGADKSLMSSDIMVSTIFSMVTLSFWLWRLG
jgi:predicted permease